MGIAGLPISCFDARHNACPLDSDWKRRVRPRKPVTTKVIGWHLYKKGDLPGQWVHHEKCACFKRNTA